MSMMKTLARVAVGVAVAKGAQAMMQGARSSGTRPAQSGGMSGGMGGLLGGLAGAMTGQTGGRAAPQAGGIEAMLGQVLGGGGGAAGGGLGGLLGQLGGAGATRGTQRGGLDDILGGLAGAGAMGGLGGILGGMLGGGNQSAAQARPAGKTMGFGDLLNQAIAGQSEPEVAPTDDQEVAAALMLRAMIQAAKSDGEIDAREQTVLLDRLSDATPEEMAFVKAELAAPVDVAGLARQVPRGLEPQIYAMSLLAIDLDTKAEAEYLDGFARALRLERDEVNDIHAQMGKPALYR